MMPEQYTTDGHTIFHGDALSVLSSAIASESIDLVVIDPPYNIGKQFSKFYDRWSSDEAYTEWAYRWLDECVRVLKPDGSLYVMSSTQAMPYFDLFLRKKLVILSRIVWHYDSSAVQATKYFGSMYEPILHCVKDKSNYTFNSDKIKIEAKTGAKRKLIDYRKSVPAQYNTEKVPGNVWCFPRVRYRMEEYESHPSQKPESLIERIILSSSNKQDLVLDPFAGTFTVGSVAKRLERSSISIESQEEYIKIGLRRVLDWQEHHGEKLSPMRKTYAKKSQNLVSSDSIQKSLFDADNTA